MLAAPNVRPWKPPRKATIPGRPVTRRASLRAASIASLPELRKKTESMRVGERRPPARGPAGRSARRSPSPPSGAISRSTWAWTAAVTRGLPWPSDADGDPVGEVEVRPAVRVVQAVALAVAPRPLEVAAEDRRQVRGGERGEVEPGGGGRGRRCPWCSSACVVGLGSATADRGTDGEYRAATAVGPRGRAVARRRPGRVAPTRPTAAADAVRPQELRP